MTQRESSLSQSRLDEAATPRSTSSLSSKPPRPSNTSGMDAAELDGNASIAFSDAASDRPSKPRSQAPSQRAPSITSARSNSGNARDPSFTAGAPQPADDSVSVSGSDRGSRPRTPASAVQRTPSTTSARGGVGGGGPSSRLASETNFAFGGAEDDDAASSLSVSADRPSKPRSVQAVAQRSPSLSGHSGAGGGGGVSGLASESSLGGASVDLGGDDDAPSAAPTPGSKPRSRAPSGTGTGLGRSREASESSNLGFSGFSTQGGKESGQGGDGSGGDGDGNEGGGDDADGAASERSSKRGAKSSAPSQRGMSSSSILGRSASGSGSRSGSRKPSEVNPGTSGAAGLGGDSFAADASIAFSDAASELKASTAGGKAPSISGGGGGSAGGRSARVSGASGTISYDKEDESAAPPPRRRSSFASSLRQSVASHKTDSDGGIGGDDGDGDGDGEAAGSASLHQSGVGGDDAASTRSGVSAASGKSRTSSAAGGRASLSASGSARSGRPASASSARSGRTAASKEASGGGKSATEGDTEYADDADEFEEDNGSGDSDGGSGGGGSADGQEDAVSESVSQAPSRTVSRASSRPVSGGSNGGYSQEELEAGSNSGRKTSRAASGSAGAAGSEAAAASAEGGSIFRNGAGPPALSVSGSILQQGQQGGGGSGGEGGGTPASSRRPGSAVFRRLPADAPDDAASGGGGGDGRNLQRSGSSMRSGGSYDAGSNGGGAAAEWNEGAVRVAAPGAPRPYSGVAGAYSSRPRPMSAAPRDRQGALLDALIRKHPATWDASDVATWVEFIGLGQYRRRFLHHGIDGRLLRRLTDAQLKSDLGIGPVGHRYAILDAAANLIKQYKEAERERLDSGGGGSDAGGADSDAGQEYGRSSTAPRSRPRPASAMPGALTGAPPPPPSHGPRRPASASRSVLPPDPFLGPAMGKVTVYEQRAKLLFELDRAQARAEQHRALAEQLQYTATLSSEEVNHIRGLLSEIERKNRAAFELSGGVDSAARVPWRHVGKGTKHNNWNPERFGRPGDPETVDLTFQPRCTNPESRKLLGLGGGDYGENSSAVNSFLDRLNNDLRKREQSKKELERRYYSDGSTNPAAQADSDFQICADALQSRCHIQLEREPAEYEVQIDEALDKLAPSESWREAGLRDGPIRAAKGPAKLAAFASAIRSMSFMERYRSDLRSKNSRLKSLEKKWINQTLGAQYLPGGKDKEDLDEAARFFALLGWRDSDGSPAEDAVDAELLDRLLDRAIEYRKKYDAWWERVRDKPEDRAAGFKCDINWSSHPWDSDGLASLMEAELQRMGEASDGPSDFVEFTVRLLGKCREDDLHRLHSLNPRPKRLGVYRAIRTQKFIEFTQKDLEERDRKLRQAYQALAPPRRKLESSRIEGFFERLVEDAAKRRAKAEKLAHDKVLKEQEILASSVMYGRRSAR